MRYFLVTFLIVSIATHAAFANKGRIPDPNRKELVSDRQQMINALKRDNQEIEETVLTIEEIQKQLEKSKRIEAIATGTRIFITLTSAFAYYLARHPAIDKASKAAKLTRIIAAVGGTTVFIGSSVIIEVQREKIQELTVLLTGAELALKQEHSANVAVLENL